MTKKLSPTELLERYLSRHDHKPLRFSEKVYGMEKSDPAPTPEQMESLERMIEWVLRNARCRESLYMSGRVQLIWGRQRSAFDIWRHIKYYLPDVELSAVLRTLAKGRWGAGWCSEVRKVVFNSHLLRISAVQQMRHQGPSEFGFKVTEWLNV